VSVHLKAQNIVQQLTTGVIVGSSLLAVIGCAAADEMGSGVEALANAN
jgi:hypothetical protein